jgi:type I restriction enzyme S subunit
MAHNHNKSIRFAQLLTRSQERIGIEPEQKYQQITVRMWGKGVIERGIIQGSAIAAPSQFVARTGQFIMSRIDARNGACGMVPATLDGAVVTNDFPLFFVNTTEILPEFLACMSKTRRFVDLCIAASEGTTNRVRLQEDRFLATEILLPPLGEQRRIVAQIEALAGRVAEAQRLRAEALAAIDVLIYAELVKMRSDMLNNFSSAKLGDITTVTSGGTPARDNFLFWDNGHIPWIKTGELLDNNIYNAEEHITVEGMNNSSAKLFPIDTVLIALYGQGQTRGRTARLMIEATTNQACCAILPFPDRLHPRFTQYWLRSLYYEMREKSHGGAQPNWNGKMIKNIEIALPPIPKQLHIIARLDELQHKVNELHTHQSATQAEIEALLPSILDKAFRGNL